MPDTVIKVENISKLYRIGLKENIHDTFAKTVFNYLKSPLQNYRKYRSLYKFDDIRPDEYDSPADIIWALKNLTFNAVRGKVLGIIGPNGSGKSTLLKIISRITDPTNGQIDVHGQVSSLLEVGTGFHPELTGTENVYLNGTILGMRKVEIDKKFDEIVQFSGVEKFLETPVKRYSTGMKVRLGFAIAAHLDPEILIVDEVLAVGDEEFQKKCLGKLENVTKEGRTVLFVSHSMPAILTLCDSVLLLEKGKRVSHGKPSEIVDQYLQKNHCATTVSLQQRTDRHGEGYARITSVKFTNLTKNQLQSLKCSDRLKIELSYESDRELYDATFMIGIYGSGISMKQSIYRLDSKNAGGLYSPLPRKGRLECITDPINLSPGRFPVNVALYVGDTLIDHVDTAAYFDIEQEDFYGTGELPLTYEVPCLLPQKWKLLADD